VEEKCWNYIYNYDVYDFRQISLWARTPPNYFSIVEILTQHNESPFGRFRVRDIKTGRVFDTFEPQLTLRWWDNPNKPTPLNPS